MEKSKEKKPPEILETEITAKPITKASLAPVPKPSAEIPSPAIQEKIKPKARPPADIKPEKKKIETKTLPKKKPESKPVVKKKAVKKVVEKKPRKENRKVEAKKQTKEKVELAALKPITRSIQPRRPAPKQSQPKDPLALFRVKPQPRDKPKLPKFGLSDEVADRIAKRSLSDKDLGKEEGETISLDTQDFRYAAYFAHIKRRIQNTWIWPVVAQKNRGELLLRFKLRKNGTLEEVRLIKSAGVRILDDLAMAAVTKAAPFEPFPEGLERKSITATFVYE
ncbi:MAG: TonB family protein [Nitrospinae bacterium]|nr:TonB family protein [Nitrospinota bacterium]